MNDDINIEILRISPQHLEPGDKLVLKLPKINLPREKLLTYARNQLKLLKKFFPDTDVLVLTDGMDIEILKQEKKEFKVED